MRMMMVSRSGSRVHLSERACGRHSRPLPTSALSSTHLNPPAETHRRMFPFTPSYLKHGRQFIKDARKLVAYKLDLVSEEILLDVEREISHLEHAVEKKDRAQGPRADAASSTRRAGKLTKPSEDAAWRENVEVFLVAIVIALAVRTYFLQPFTIHTGSMQPTLTVSSSPRMGRRRDRTADPRSRAGSSG